MCSGFLLLWVSLVDVGPGFGSMSPERSNEIVSCILVVRLL
jgi:hypothetical protein